MYSVFFLNLYVQALGRIIPSNLFIFDFWFQGISQITITFTNLHQDKIAANLNFQFLSFFDRQNVIIWFLNIIHLKTHVIGIFCEHID